MKKSCFKGCFCSKEGFNKSVMLNSFQHLHLRRGFTLIELLVVVLIIGILAAVAVPQYKQAVNKARAMEAVTMLSSIVKAQKIYFLTHGEYTNDLGELDVLVPAELRSHDYNINKPFQYYYYCFDKYSCAATAAAKDLPVFEFKLSSSTRWCQLWDRSSNNSAKKICQSLGTQDQSMGGTSSIYYLLN